LTQPTVTFNHLTNPRPSYDTPGLFDGHLHESINFTRIQCPCGSSILFKPVVYPQLRQ